MKLKFVHKRAIADLLVNCELIRHKNGYYKGKLTHSAATIEQLIRWGYADINTRSGQGQILSVMPTEKAVYLIPASA